MQFTESAKSEHLMNLPPVMPMPFEVSEQVESDFKINSLGEEITKRLYKIPFFGSTDGGVPSYLPQLKHVKQSMLDDVEKGLLIKQIHLERHGINIEHVIELEKRIITDLFKGVDKNLATPILLTGLENFDNPIARGTMPNSFPAAFAVREAVVSFNPKNLQKFYKYPIEQSKIFYKNVRTFIDTYPSDKSIKLAIPDRLDERNVYYRNLYSLPTLDQIHYMWSYGQGDDVKVVGGDVNDKKFLACLEKNDLPIPNIASWREIAREYFERENNGESWDSLCDAKQKRILTNTIRHNSIGYERAWRNTTDEARSEFHDKAFSIVLRKIMNQFPYLRNECVRQLNRLEDLNKLPA